MNSKTKRIRHVVPSREVAHLWAHHAQDNARNASRNVSFDGDFLKSYRLTIARHYKTKNGKDCILMIDRPTSLTTARHVHSARCAIPSEKLVIEVQEPHDGVTDGDIEHLETQMLEVLGRMKGCQYKNMAYLLECALGRHVYAVRLYKLFGVRKPISYKRHKVYRAAIARLTRLEDPNTREGKRRTARQVVEARANDARRALLAKHEEDVKNFYLIHDAAIRQAWRSYTPIPQEVIDAANAANMKSHEYHDMRPRDVVFRYVAGSDAEIESSLGARVTVDHMTKAIAFVESLVARNEVKGFMHATVSPQEVGREYLYQSNGHTFHIGPYTLDVVWSNGDVKAGCHNVKYAEVLRLKELIANHVPCLKPAN